MSLFKYDLSDLRANQNGRLSPNQQARWVEADQWSQSVVQTAVPLGIFLLILIVGIVISLAANQPLIGSLASVVLALLVGGGVWLGMRREQTAVPPQIPAVGRAEGIAKLTDEIEYDEHNASRRYRLEIKNHTFQLFNKQQFEALENGARYAVYYLDNEEKHIVSLEKLN
ncbi:hypothetical protein [Candidatus Leptofilum sp.]|uniref:hypothetical protein n=1 Tax=Candidatus Leptofilum sp. TaxID=3241576 RepID=UPI003B5A3B2A